MAAVQWLKAHPAKMPIERACPVLFLAESTDLT